MCLETQFRHRNFALSVTGNFVEGVSRTEGVKQFVAEGLALIQIFYYVFNAYIGTQAAILYESAPLAFGLFFACL